MARLFDGDGREAAELNRIEATAQKAIKSLGKRSPDAGKMVWVTDSVDRYHRKDCRFCDESGKPVSLEAVIALGMEPCRVCRP